MMNNLKKTILFLCNCGTNIANFIDTGMIKKWAEENESLETVEIHNLLCSPDGKKFFSETISKLKPDEVIIAACSPAMHEKTFRKLAEETGALKRSEYNIDLEKKSMKCMTDILVIGGGISGIESAITASKAGRKVYIVEKEISIGGSVIKSEEIAPPMQCAPCLLAPILSQVRDDPNINVITNASVKEVKGFSGNFTVNIEKKARFVEDSCIGCEACFETCPVSTENKFHYYPGSRKAIYTLFPGSVPATAAIDSKSCKHFTDGSCEACVPLCPFNSINFNQQDEEIEINVGAIILATGFKPGDPSDIKELSYKKYENIYTTYELESMASSTGPTSGKILLKNGKVPSSVAVIHCAGSLRNDAIPYCSGICCTVASKAGELFRKQNPETKVYNIHNDLVFSTPKEHAFYLRQVENGTHYVKTSDLLSIKIEKKEESFLIKSVESEIEAEMIILATGVEAGDDTKSLAKLLHVDTDDYGFFKTAHDLLNATASSLDGIYLAGCAAGPCDVKTSVTRGKSAAGDAISTLIPGKEIELEIMTSVIDEEKCSGCKLCIKVCPYNAIEFDNEKNVSRIIEAICRGCGTCSATCPCGASSAKHFTDEQIYAEIGGIINE